MHTPSNKVLPKNALTMVTQSPPGVVPFAISFGFNNFPKSGGK